MLRANKLPLEGAQAHLDTYLLAVSNGEIVGCAGAEVYGHIALLRSVAVAPGLHRQGIGKLLLDRLIHEAQRRDIVRLYLLSVTAPEYFAQFGFKRANDRRGAAGTEGFGRVPGRLPGLRSVHDARRCRKRLAATMPCLWRCSVPDRSAWPLSPGCSSATSRLSSSKPASRSARTCCDYGHVRLFSPWQYNIDPAMARRLALTGWQAPPAQELPLARDVVERVLRPFAALPEVASALQLNTRVVALSREGFDKVKSAGRERRAVRVRAVQNGKTVELRARSRHRRHRHLGYAEPGRRQRTAGHR